MKVVKKLAVVAFVALIVGGGLSACHHGHHGHHGGHHAGHHGHHGHHGGHGDAK